MGKIKLDKTSYVNKISDMDEMERPRERIVHYGIGALTNYELIAALLGSGSRGENVLDLAKRILYEFGGMRGIKKITLDQLKEINGIGLAKGTKLLAAIELGRRFSALKDDDDAVTIKSSEDVYNLVHYEMEDLDHEELWVLNLDTKRKLMGMDRLYRGSLNSSTVRVAEIFQNPIKKKASAIILVHNHPSGDSKPSVADIAVTKQISDAGTILELPLLDHLIIGRGAYLSMKTENMF